MGTITKTPLQRTVTISLDGANAVTHAWQTTTYSIQEDGVEISRQTGNHENLEPDAIAVAVPQADLLKQLNDVTASHVAAAQAADVQLATIKQAADEQIAALTRGAADDAAKAAAALVAETNAHTATRADLQAKLDRALGQLASAQDHATALVAAIAPPAPPAA